MNVRKSNCVASEKSGSVNSNLPSFKELYTGIRTNAAHISATSVPIPKATQREKNFFGSILPSLERQYQQK